MADEEPAELPEYGFVVENAGVLNACVVEATAAAPAVRAPAAAVPAAEAVTAAVAAAPAVRAADAGLGEAAGRWEYPEAGRWLAEV